eukprot:5798906-Amphidinium_carterae.1
MQSLAGQHVGSWSQSYVVLARSYHSFVARLGAPMQQERGVYKRTSLRLRHSSGQPRCRTRSAMQARMDSSSRLLPEHESFLPSFCLEVDLYHKVVSSGNRSKARLLA